MYINFGNDLFLPEGDDYSKKEFDEKAEIIVSQGAAILHELRLQQEAERATRPLPKKVEKPKQEPGKKLTYKEILESVAASK